MSNDAKPGDAKPGAKPDVKPDAKPGDPMSTGAALRRPLLAKLPPLEYHGASVLEAVKLDADADLRSALELDAEAFLAPLDQTLRRGAR